VPRPLVEMISTLGGIAAVTALYSAVLGLVMWLATFFVSSCRRGCRSTPTASPTWSRPLAFNDALEILDAGISVLTAVNIQHLETLNDAVARATGVRVRETVPDTFVDRADEVVTWRRPASVRTG